MTSPQQAPASHKNAEKSGEAEGDAPVEEEVKWCWDRDLCLIQTELIVYSFNDILMMNMLRVKIMLVLSW